MANPRAKATIARQPWRGTAGQQRDTRARAKAGQRLLGPTLPLPGDADEGRVRLDEVDVNLTHLRKVWYPDGATKRDLLDYNYDVAEFLLPHLRDRPYTQKRFPDGIEGQFFFQKEAGAQAPEWVRTVEEPSAGERRHINFILCNDCPTLLYLVNNGCLDHNIWMSRYTTPHAPDFTLIDLDPGDRAGFDKVIKVAQGVRKVLDEYEIAGYPKTSGATGMHIWIPLAPGHTYEQSSRFAALLLRMAAQRVPDLATEVWQTHRRPPDRVYLDYRQNGYGKTIPPPYSARPRPGAPVSTPLQWSEVRAGLEPGQFTIRSMRKRLEKFGDLFAAALPSRPGQSIAKMLARMDAE